MKSLHGFGRQTGELAASYMGFSRLGLAIGGAIGYIGGGWLFGWANRRTSQSFRGYWAVLASLRWVGSLARNAPRIV